MPITPQQAFEAYRTADLLHSEQAVEAALDRIAAQITERLADSNPVLLCVLTGGIIPVGKLTTRLNFPLQLDYLHATRYRGATSGGELHWIAHPSITLRDRVVLVVDDILDEGATLAAIIEHCQAEGASSVLSAVLVDKIHDRKYLNIKADFTGLEVPDRYVFGCGMDYKSYLRNAPGIYAVHDA